MKKIALLPIALACLLSSCGDSKSVSVADKVSTIPTKEQAIEILANVSTQTAASNAKVGSKEHCDAIAKALEDADALLFSGASIDDPAVISQLETLERMIDACMANKEVTSFDFMKDGIKDAANSCRIPSGLDLKGFAKAEADAIMGFKDCTSYDQLMADIYKKYSKEAAYIGMIRDTCDDLPPSADCPAEECIEDMQIETLGTMDEKKLLDFDMNELAILSCELEFDKDPCDGKICPIGHICIAGNCENICSAITCNSGFVCSNGFCVPDESKKSCKDDASICKDNQKCDTNTGVCIPKTCKDDASICTDKQTCNDQGVCVAKTDKTCKEDASICKDNQKCDTNTGTCVAKTCKDDASICNKDQVCNDSGVCVAKPVKTCVDDASICTTGLKCDTENAKCVLDCDALVNTKAAVLEAIKHYATCAEIDDGYEKIEKGLIQDGVRSSEVAENVMEACGMIWAGQANLTDLTDYIKKETACLDEELGGNACQKACQGDPECLADCSGSGNAYDLCVKNCNGDEQCLELCEMMNDF